MSMKTIRTKVIREIVEKEEIIKQKPKFSKGDYVEIYYGSSEGSCFWISDMRYNHDRESFEYLHSGFLGGWYKEDQLVRG